MDNIRAKLNERLVSKGLDNNEIALFIKDVIRAASHSTVLDLEYLKQRLNLLGWSDDYLDYGTIQLIQACYQDN